MKYLLKFIWVLPLCVIFAEIIFNLSAQNIENLTPVSSKNTFSSNLINLLDTTKISYSKLDQNIFQDEVTVTIKTGSSNYSTVIFSSNKSPLNQVNALQKLIKIANIKHRDIKFIDLSSQRPYATL